MNKEMKKSNEENVKIQPCKNQIIEINKCKYFLDQLIHVNDSRFLCTCCTIKLR